jgi:hypothetical protein
MSCIRPGEVTAEDLIAYVSGEATRPVANHVQSCPRCSADALAYARADRRLRRAFDRIECPSPARLGEYELGLIAGNERWAIAGHVAECRRCADELKSFRGFLADEPEPLPSLAAQVRRVISAILAPSPDLAYGAFRGTSGLQTRTFRADDVTITIGPGPLARPGRVSIDGLVVGDQGDPDQFSGCQARLMSGTGPAVAARVDDLGSFLIEDVAPGVYRLELDLADRLIVVDGISLGK